MGDHTPFTAERVALSFEIEEHPVDVTEKLRVSWTCGFASEDSD